MPIVIRQVRDKKYVYFTRFNRLTGRKEDTYCGTLGDEAMDKAKNLEAEYVRDRATYQKERPSGLSAANKARIFVEQIAAKLLPVLERLGYTIERNQKTGWATLDFVFWRGEEMKKRAYAIEAKTISTYPSLRDSQGQISLVSGWPGRILFVLIFVGDEKTRIRLQSLAVTGRTPVEGENAVWALTENSEIRILVDHLASLDGVSQQHVTALSGRILRASGVPLKNKTDTEKEMEAFVAGIKDSDQRPDPNH